MRLTMRKTRRLFVRYNAQLILDDAGARGWMATDLARIAEVSDATLSNVLKGIRCTPKTAGKLAKALGHPVDRYLISSEKGRAA